MFGGVTRCASGTAATAPGLGRGGHIHRGSKDALRLRTLSKTVEAAPCVGTSSTTVLGAQGPVKGRSR